MRIGLDIDDTVCKTGRIIQKKAEEFARRRGIEEPVDANEDYNMEKRWGFDGDDMEGFKTYVRREVDIRKLKLVDGLRKFIKWAKRNGHTIIIITTRNEEWFCGDEEVLHKRTVRWLKRHGIEAKEIYYAENVKDKARIAKENRCQRMIDDDYEVCKECKRAGIDAVWFTGEFGKISGNDMQRQVRDYPIKTLVSWRKIGTIE